MSLISDKTRKIVDGLFERDEKMMLNYERLVFNTYLTNYRDRVVMSQEDEAFLMHFLRHSIDSGIKIEGISRYRRLLTGVTQGVRGRFYNTFRHLKSLEKESKVKTELGY